MNCPSGYRQLDAGHDLWHRVIGAARSHDEMYVFLHKDEGPQVKRMLYAGTLNRLSQPLAGAICLQKLKTAVARERQFMNMPRRVDCLAMESCLLWDGP